MQGVTRFKLQYSDTAMDTLLTRDRISQKAEAADEPVRGEHRARRRAPRQLCTFCEVSLLDNFPMKVCR